MRHHLAASVLALGGCVACVSYLQEYVAFGNAPLSPAPRSAEVGDLVPFEVRPPVPAGSMWSLQIRQRVRFTDTPEATSRDWTASPTAIHLETMVSPWDPPVGREHSSHDWLWYSLRDQGESNVLERDLPFRRVAYREIAPVTFAATFAPGAKEPELSVTERNGRIIATYRTPTEQGTPHAPRIDTMLLESGNRTILYAEVRSDFGNVAREPIGYDVTLSYDKSRVSAPAEILVVGWMGNGDYWKPFTVNRWPPGPK
jgi:hypothetical protein